MSEIIKRIMTEMMTMIMEMMMMTMTMIMVMMMEMMTICLPGLSNNGSGQPSSPMTLFDNNGRSTPYQTSVLSPALHLDIPQQLVLFRGGGFIVFQRNSISQLLFV